MKKITWFALIGIMLCSWTFLFTTDNKMPEWLVGTWKNSASRGNIYETWTKKNDLEFTGRSYMIRNQDTMVFETIRLIQENDQLFYIPTVDKQNNNEPVRFALKTASDSELVFENALHDFPQRITYTRITNDSLVAEISGNRNGKERKQTFPMSRVKIDFLK